MAVNPIRPRRPRPPFDPDTLERAALHYVERFATTRAKLAAFLRRKVRERGWSEEGEPPIDELVERLAGLGYVDDKAFAAARANSLSRRGYGERRVEAAMRAAGIAEADSAPAREAARDQAWPAALRLAQKKRIGPFAESQADRAGREKAFAAMLRAGHPMDIVRRIVDSPPGRIPDWDSD